jgi:hypothetical protein
VGSFAPTAFDLLDLSGNVWEWTSSWFGAYPEEAVTGQTRVYRGGSWSRRFPKWMRTTLRNRYRPDQRSSSLGVRCARTAQPLTCPDGAEPRGERCVRVVGTPGCEPAFRWQGGKCVLDVPSTRPPPEVALEAGGERGGGAGSAGGPGAPPPGTRGAMAATPAVAAAAPAAAAAAPRTTGASEAVPPGGAAPAGAADAEPIRQSRDPGADEDCQKNFQGAPIAYRISGGTFHEREPVFRASGCRKRDVSRASTSLCCAR